MAARSDGQAARTPHGETLSILIVCDDCDWRDGPVFTAAQAARSRATHNYRVHGRQPSPKDYRICAQAGIPLDMSRGLKRGRQRER